MIAVGCRQALTALGRPVASARYAALARATGIIGIFFWTSDLWTVPYLLFWTWLLVLSVRLIRRPNLLEPVAI
jgi:hypothetical protein